MIKVLMKRVMLNWLWIIRERRETMIESHLHDWVAYEKSELWNVISRRLGLEYARITAIVRPFSSR